MFYKVRKVQARPNHELLVSFMNGEEKIYHVAPLVQKWKSFEQLLSTSGLFECVKVDMGGYGISWNDDLDLSCNEPYHNGISVV